MKSGETESNRLPAPTAAHQRAPTLIASANAGGQGQVTVCAPGRLRLWGNLLLPVPWLVLLPWVASRAFMRHDFIGALLFCLWTVTALKALASAYRSWRRPCYITTDDAGIGVTTRKGSHAIRWPDVVGLRTVGTRIFIKVLIKWIGAVSAVEILIDLSGYPPITRGVIREWIAERARLRPHPYQPGDYVSADFFPPPLHSTLTISRRKPRPRLPRRITSKDDSRSD